MALLKRFIRVARPYWQSEDRWKGIALVLVSLVFSLGVVYSLYLLTNWNQQFYDAIQRMDLGAFTAAIKRFSILVVAIILTFVGQYYFSQLLVLRWRKWLTLHAIDRWLHRGNYYFANHLRERSDNPDQRISEDVRDFVDSTVGLALDAFRQLISLATFSFLLWQLSGSFVIAGLRIPGFMLWASILYALSGTAISHWIGRKIAPLNYSQQTYEADFRFHLVRVRENAESILLMSGSPAERRRLDQAFRAVLRNFLEIVKERTRLGIFTNLYSNAASIFPIVVAAPRYFSKQLSLGQIFQIAGAFARVNEALSFVIQSYAAIAHWASVVDRLDGFYEAMDRSQALRDETERKFSIAQPTDAIEARGLRLEFPESGGATLPMSLKVGPGESLMIMGPSGIGKSTILRVFTKLWPYFDGWVALPDGQRPMVIPQKPYLPIGTLKASITYPMEPESFADHDVAALLDLCGLEKLKPALERQEHWSQVLSPGEQQRLAWIRAFLQKPNWLLLDEATSALDAEMQSTLYRELARRLPQTMVISVAHRGELSEFHAKVLQVEQAS